MDKYIVFKKAEWDDKVGWSPMFDIPEPVEDAVVIRRQDVFAPPALDAYANAIQTAVEVMSGFGITPGGSSPIDQLRDIADYFHDQAAKAWAEQRKLPD